jgi:hypothetical protein
MERAEKDEGLGKRGRVATGGERARSWGGRGRRKVCASGDAELFDSRLLKPTERRLATRIDSRIAVADG